MRNTKLSAKELACPARNLMGNYHAEQWVEILDNWWHDYMTYGAEEKPNFHTAAQFKYYDRLRTYFYEFWCKESQHGKPKKTPPKYYAFQTQNLLSYAEPSEWLEFIENWFHDYMIHCAEQMTSDFVVIEVYYPYHELKKFFAQFRKEVYYV